MKSKPFCSYYFFETQIKTTDVTLIASLRIYPWSSKEAMLLIHCNDECFYGTYLENITVYLDYNEGLGLYRNRKVWLRDYTLEIWELTLERYEASLSEAENTEDFPW